MPGTNPMSRGWRLVAVAATTVSLCAAAVVAADPADATTTTTTPMTTAWVVGVVSNHPDAAGRITVTLDTGATISIPAADRDLALRAGERAGAARPDNTVYGTCGSSYITVNHKSNGQPVHMDTGFTVKHDAISYSWYAEISGFSGSGYDYSYHASGDLNFDSTWHGQHSSDKNYPHGTYHAYVTSPSYAMLDTGDICVSGDPYDYSNL